MAEEFRVSIRIEGAAIRDNPDQAIADMLVKLAGQIRSNAPIGREALDHPAILFDTNGNRVGQVKVYQGEDES